MSKKDTVNNKPSFFIRLPFLITLLAVGGLGWWAWQEGTEWKDALLQYIENKEILTLESKYTPEQIMETHQQDLLGATGKRTYQNTLDKNYPYLLLDVKYTEDKNSHEGVLLWGLYDGEIVLDTDTWKTTHGFKDCLDCGAERNDLKILNTLARHSGSLPIDELQKELNVERDLLNDWLESAKQKHLIVQKGHVIQLHFENPKLVVIPQTQMKQHLVSKPIQNGQRVARVYSRNQIIQMAKIAFGNDFKIRSEKEIFLPAYSLQVLNPDGSVHSSEWNALTGEPISPSYISNTKI